MSSLKQKLLEIGIVVDNEYLDKYIELIESNKFTHTEKYKTQKHHIIPKYYYKHNLIEVDSSCNNLVNLHHKDHVIAHYYLAMCSSRDDFRYANVLAVRHSLGHSNFKLQNGYEDDLEFVKNLNSYQTLMEECNAVKRPKELIKQISESLKKVPHTKEWVEKVRLANLGKKMSEEAKHNISVAHQGKKCVNKDGVIKYICAKDVESYINDGWRLGRNRKNNTTKYFKRWNKGLTLAECPSLSHKWSDEQKKLRCGEGNPMYGKKVPKETLQRIQETRKKNGNLAIRDSTKEKISNTLNGYISVYNATTGEERHIRPEKLEEFLNDGFIRGHKPKQAVLGACER